MVHHTRLDCAVAPAAYMRSALAQALWHTSYRRAFGKRLIDHELMKQVLADLAVESEAATALVFRLARSFDEAGKSEDAALFSRIATPIAKYWLNKRVIGHVAECMECHGGAGYVEEWPIARLYRQAPLNGIWEGSGNVICLDVLRVLKREPRALDAFVAELERARGANARLGQAIDALKSELRTVDEKDARRLVEAMAVTLQAALLVQHAPAPVAEAFCATRLGARATAYGAMSSGIDVAAVISRAMPV
jgi:putative acyl-CoA dehydrogenase